MLSLYGTSYGQGALLASCLEANWEHSICGQLTFLLELSLQRQIFMGRTLRLGNNAPPLQPYGIISVFVSLVP